MPARVEEREAPGGEADLAEGADEQRAPLGAERLDDRLGPGRPLALDRGEQQRRQLPDRSRLRRARARAKAVREEQPAGPWPRGCAAGPAPLTQPPKERRFERAGLSNPGGGWRRARVPGGGPSGRRCRRRPAPSLRRRAALGRRLPPRVGAHDPARPRPADGRRRASTTPRPRPSRRSPAATAAPGRPTSTCAGSASRRSTRTATRRIRPTRAASARRSTPSASRARATTASASTSRAPPRPRPSSRRRARTRSSARSRCPRAR